MGDLFPAFRVTGEDLIVPTLIVCQVASILKVSKPLWYILGQPALSSYKANLQRNYQTKMRK